MITKLLFALLLVSASFTFASGTMTLIGKMAGKTEKTFSIESNAQIFIFNKAVLSESQVKALEPLKWGEPVTLNVPMSGIVEVKSASVKNNIKK